MRAALLVALSALVLVAPMTPAAADSPAVKIGVLTDMSGAYGDAAGRGSVVAAELAVEDLGSSLLGKPVGDATGMCHRFSSNT